MVESGIHRTVARVAAAVTLALVAGGCQLHTWGENDVGQVGDGTTVDRSTPVEIAGTGWIAVSAGGGHTCAIRVDRSLWCWGQNDYGQVGDATTTTRARPVRIGAAADWTTVEAGSLSTCGIRAGGTAWCWGSNELGQLGDGTVADRNVPSPVVGGPAQWVSIDAAVAHACGVGSDGSGWCWGSDSAGRLGNGAPEGPRSSPVAVAGGPGSWASISAGSAHSCGVGADGSGWCWGYNRSGRLGDDTVEQRNAPVAVVGGPATWRRIDAGGEHTCGLGADGSAWCWGWNRFGQLGDTTTTTRQVPIALGGGAATWVEVDTGDAHTCGIGVDGSAWCWGWNRFGQLGDATTTDRWQPTAVASDDEAWRWISTGDRHTIALPLSLD